MIEMSPEKQRMSVALYADTRSQFDVSLKSWQLLRRIASEYPSLVLGVGLLVVLIATASITPVLFTEGPNDQNYGALMVTPNAKHLLGTDNLGRDLFIRTMYGIRLSLMVATFSIVISVSLGIPLGLIAGAGSNIVDNMIMRPLDALMAFPAIIIALILASVFGTGVMVVIVAIGIVTTPTIAKVLRASVLTTRDELFAEAARARGLTRSAILIRYILLNSLGPTIVQATILMGTAVILESTLSFLGIGIRPPTSSLGIMLAEGRNYMMNSAWLVITPGIAIACLVLGFNLSGDGLRDYLDPRKRRR
jgi:ABC-type dipeptide/oligopeptide/nickel transport system permease subunit